MFPVKKHLAPCGHEMSLTHAPPPAPPPPPPPPLSFTTYSFRPFSYSGYCVALYFPPLLAYSLNIIHLSLRASMIAGGARPAIYRSPRQPPNK